MPRESGDGRSLARRHDRALAVVMLMACVVRGGTAADAAAQGVSTELWPEIDVYWSPAARQRTLLEVSSSTEREGPKREATVGVYQDYLRLPAGYFRGGFRYTFSTRDASYREYRGVAEATTRAYQTRTMRLLNRARLEGRWVNGDFSYRLRDRLHLQRMPPITSARALAPYVTLEAYYDSKYRTIARIGGRIGSEAHLRGPVGVDVYIARQNNSRTEPRYVNALGVSLRLDY